MRARASFQAAAGFTAWRAIHPSGLRLEQPPILGELTAPAPDVFRVRFGRPADPATRQNDPAALGLPRGAFAASPFSVRLAAAGHRHVVRLSTPEATLTFDRQSGAWAVHDRAGLEVFRARVGETGFCDRAARVGLELAHGESLLGLGETTGPLNKRGSIKDLWNTDVLGHHKAVHPGLRSLYLSIPFLISIREGRVAGLFWDNPARQVWDLGATQDDRLTVTAASGPIDLYLFAGPTLEGVLRRFTELTGRMSLPPYWALGYQQCRYSYPTRKRLEAVATRFRRRRLPCDVLYLDIHHLDGHRVFTFGRAFPRPAEMLRRLARRGFKAVTIVDPGVKDDPRFGTLRRGCAHDAFVKAPRGRRDFLGEVWPGRVRYPDFLHAPTRGWWGREQARLARLGVAGFWNDMNEPANFARPDKTLDPRARHRTDAGIVRHAAVHNLYGLTMARASFEGALEHARDRRPFVVTRAGWAGVQRYAAVWTGDNSSCWEHLAESIPMLLNLGLSGVPFCGTDVGGFRDHTTGELLARWTQVAAFTPFFRNHSDLGTRDQEPWAFGPEIEAIHRRYLELRYQLLAYLYAAFVEAQRHGTPVMRPLAWHFANDPVAVACGDQFLLGASLLVAPVLQPGAVARSVYLPAGNWFDFWTGAFHHGRQHIVAEADLATLPLFVRAGAVLPILPVHQCTDERPYSIVNLHVWPGAAGEQNWYEDDGSSLGYQRDQWHERTIAHRHGRLGGTLCLSEVRGAFPSRVRHWRVIVRHATRAYRLRVNGRPGEGEHVPEVGLFVFTVPNAAARIEARWW